MHDLLLAYIDPGSGSLLIQAAIATLVAIPFFFRHHIGRFVRAIRREPAPQEESPSTERDPSDLGRRS